MKTTLVAVLVGGLVSVALIGAATAQERIDNGSSSYYGGYSNFGGYYDTFGANGGFGGNSGYGTYRRRDTGAGSTTATTGTIFALPLVGGAENSTHCRWLKGRADATNQRIWRKRYAACLQDYK